MELIVDANVVISALIADGTTRELIVTIVADLSTPSVIRDEVESHRTASSNGRGSRPTWSRRSWTSSSSSSRSSRRTSSRRG